MMHANARRALSLMLLTVSLMACVRDVHRRATLQRSIRPTEHPTWFTCGGTEASAPAIAFRPYRDDRPFEVASTVRLDLAPSGSVPEETAQRIRCALRSGECTRDEQCRIHYATEAVRFEDTGSVTATFVGYVSPRITQLRHGALLATIDCGEADAPHLTTRARIVLVKPAAGFADTHNHPFASQGFDEQVVFGLPWCPLEQDGLACDRHHIGRATLSEELTGGTHGPARGRGYPTFEDWPTAGSWTHMMSHPAMLHRAVRGGMRLLVAHALNNFVGCVSGLNVFDRGQIARCRDDRESVRAQVRAAYWTQSFVDRLYGGPGRGWFRIVRTPREARRVMSEGNLAVILGIEVDNPFGCTRDNPQCTPEYISSQLDVAYACGVRHMFPVHFWNNAFGATAMQNPLSGPSGDAVPCTDERYLFPGHRHFGDYGLVPWYPDALFESTAACNRFGLTGTGRSMLLEMMRRRMIIDVDHMSDRALSDVMSVVDNDRSHVQIGCDNYAYPVMAGHATLLTFADGQNRQEGNITPEEMARIRDTGGMISLITLPGLERDTITQAPMHRWRGDPFAFDHPGTSQTLGHHFIAAAEMFPSGIGFGTDMNGGVTQPRARFPRAGHSTPDSHHEVRLTYPIHFDNDHRRFPALDGNSLHSRRGDFEALGPHVITAHTTCEFGLPSSNQECSEVSSLPPPSDGRWEDKRVFDFNTDGLSHAGMLPDLIADLQTQGIDGEQVDVLLRSAEEYVSMWERAEAAAERMGLSRPVTSQTCPWDIDSEPVCPSTLRTDTSPEATSHE